MRILALETSGAAGSVAALAGEQLVSERFLPQGQRSAQALAPAVAAALAEAGWRPQDVELIAVTQGPGSFTGLRIGAATAKTLAYAIGCELLGVNTLEAVAAQAPAECGEAWTVLDAHRGQLFVARFRLREGQPPEAIEPTCIETVPEWLGRYSPEQWVSGPGLARVAARLPRPAAMVDRALWTPQAATVGRLALWRYRQGRRDDVWTFAPHYYRPSAAEERYPS